jgi:hypothetical protein
MVQSQMTVRHEVARIERGVSLQAVSTPVLNPLCVTGNGEVESEE